MKFQKLIKAEENKQIVDDILTMMKDLERMVKSSNLSRVALLNAKEGIGNTLWHLEINK